MTLLYFMTSLPSHSYLSVGICKLFLLLIPVVGAIGAYKFLSVITAEQIVRNYLIIILKTT